MKPVTTSILRSHVVRTGFRQTQTMKQPASVCMILFNKMRYVNICFFQKGLHQNCCAMFTKCYELLCYLRTAKFHLKPFCTEPLLDKWVMCIKILNRISRPEGRKTCFTLSSYQRTVRNFKLV